MNPDQKRLVRLAEEVGFRKAIVAVTGKILECKHSDVLSKEYLYVLLKDLSENYRDPS